MAGKTEGQILAEVLDNTRQLTRWYISLLKGYDPFKQFVVDGKQLNSAYWLIGHLAWTQNNMLLKTTGGKAMDIPWEKHFGFGKALDKDAEGLPGIKEILDTLKELQQRSVDHLRQITPEELDEPNPGGIAFGGDSSKRMMVHHVIRHEGVHAGHLSWICKLHGVKTI